VAVRLLGTEEARVPNDNDPLDGLSAAEQAAFKHEREVARLELQNEAIEAKLATKERSGKRRVHRHAKRSKENKVIAPLDKILDPDPYYDCTAPSIITGVHS
jgi:hypothetical protein